MNRQALAKAIAERVEISQRLAEDALFAMTGIIEAELTAGRSVALVRFGKFSPVMRKARESVHPQKPAERCSVDAHRAVRFRPSIALKKSVRICQ